MFPPDVEPTWINKMMTLMLKSHPSPEPSFFREKPASSRSGCRLVSQSHTAGRFCSKIYADTEKIRRASSFAPLATHAILSPRRGSNLTRLATVPGNHLQDIQGASSDTLSASDTSVIDFD